MPIGNEGDPREREGHLGPHGVVAPLAVSGVDGLHTVSELMVDDGLVVARVALLLGAPPAEVGPGGQELM